jgi:lipopolysaccharide transport system permease protein
MDAQEIQTLHPMVVEPDVTHPITRVRIEPSRGFRSLNLRDLWTHRELVYFMIWRDVKVRYKQTALGAAWAVLQPLLTMAIFSLFFGRLTKMPSDGVPYPMFTFVALVPWTFFSNGLTLAANSLVQNANLLTKVYFPRLAIPLATVLVGLVDLLLSFVVLLGLIAYYHIPLTPRAFYLPLFLVLSVVTTLGVSLWLAALNVQFRDVRFTIPFLVQVWMFATPVVYPSSLIPQPWRTLFGINPMVGVVEGFRWALLPVSTHPGPMTAISSLVGVAVIVSGALYFCRMERTFADIV